MTALTPEQQSRVLALAADLARHGRTEELLEFLDHGVPVDTVAPEGNSLWMLAAYNGAVDTVTALLDRGADADLRNGRDQSVIAGAMFKGEDDIVRLLLAAGAGAGADVDAGTPTARQAATMFGRSHLLEQ